jgi:hypothetical protein
MNETPVRLYAIEKNPDDGLFYLHTDRELAANGKDFISNKLPQGFPTEAVAREHARLEHGAADSEIAPNSGVR